MQISSLFLSIISVIISIYFEVSYALLLSEYGFVLFMHDFILVCYLSCAEQYYFDVELLLCESGFRPQILLRDLLS